MIEPAAPRSLENPTPAGSAQRIHPLHWITLILILGAAIAVRLYCLGCKPFWFDETFSVEVARMDWPNFFRVLWWREANMSLYYLLLRAWLHFGATQFFIRSLSVVFAAFTVPALYWLGKLLRGPRVALAAAALFAFNAFDIRYSQEARSYALFLLLATLSSGFLVAFLQRGTSRLRTGYIVLSTLAVYAHLYALLMLAAHWLVLRRTSLFTPMDADQHQSHSIAGDLRHAWKVIAISVAPLILFVLKTGAGPIRWIPRPGLTAVLEFLRYFTSGTPLVLAAACALALAPLGKRLFRRATDWETFRLQFLAVWLLFPILLTLLISVARPVFYPRYMIFCLPPLLILVAIGIFTVRPRWLAAAAICILIVLSTRMIPFVWAYDFEDERDGAGAATNFILDHAQPGDGIVFHIPQTRVPYDFFRSLRAGKPVNADEFGPEILYPRHGEYLQYLDFKSKPSAQELRSLIASHPRVWVVLMYNGPKLPDPGAEVIKQTLSQSYPNMQHWEFAKVVVILYGK